MAITAVDTESGPPSAPQRCWCCGRGPDQALGFVPLRAHAEVIICFACVKYLDRARAEQKSLFLARFAAEVLRQAYPALAEKMYVRTAVLDWHSRTLETVTENLPNEDRSEMTAASF